MTVAIMVDNKVRAELTHFSVINSSFSRTKSSCLWLVIRFVLSVMRCRRVCRGRRIEGNMFRLRFFLFSLQPGN